MTVAKESRRKVDGLQRILAAEETFDRVRSFAGALGVTRLADITGLDRIGIPTYSAIVPRSRDVISVYNGKGLRPIDAKAGALMEAFERQTILNASLPMIQGSFENLKKTHRILDPRSLGERLEPGYREDKLYSWVSGSDLVSGEPVLVPADFAGYLWNAPQIRGCFQCSGTSGMAAGNCREEAVCQALCELIERDAWSLVELAARALPWARRRLAFGLNAPDGNDDFEVAPSLDLDGEPTLILFHRAGLFPVVHDMTSDLGIPSVFAAVPDELLPGFPMVHCGLGAHPDAAVATRRALTEAAQSRCVDIQGVREDLAPSDAPLTELTLHTRRASSVNRRHWFLGESKVRRRLSDLDSHSFDDLQLDIDHIVSRLASSGISQVVVVDFPSICATVSVVRVVVPGLESWAMNHGTVGTRALDHWRRHA